MFSAETERFNFYGLLCNLMGSKGVFKKSVIEILSISRSEQTPGSEFHPRDKSEKNYCGFLGPSCCNKKVNPETYVPCGSYELLLSNVAHQM